MSPSLVFLIGCAVGAAIAIAAASSRLPWAVRVWFLVNTPAVDPWFGLGPLPGSRPRAVRLRAVEAHRGDVEVTVAEIGTGRASRALTLTRHAIPPAAVARLDGWMALRAPLILATEDDAGVTVHGPDGTVTNLALAGVRHRSTTSE